MRLAFSGLRCVRITELLLAVALALEYESVCGDPAQWTASGLGTEEVEVLVSAFPRFRRRRNHLCDVRSFAVLLTRWCLRPRSTVVPIC